MYWQSAGDGNGTPLQYSCLENPMDGGAWWAAVHGVQRGRHNWAAEQQHWQPTWAVVTELHRPDGLQNPHLLLHIFKAGCQDCAASRAGCWWGLSSWLADGCLLAASSRGLVLRACTLLVSFLIRPPGLLDQGPTFLSSCNLSCLLKGLI